MVLALLNQNWLSHCVNKRKKFHDLGRFISNLITKVCLMLENKALGGEEWDLWLYLMRTKFIYAPGTWRTEDCMIREVVREFQLLGVIEINEWVDFTFLQLDCKYTISWKSPKKDLLLILLHQKSCINNMYKNEKKQKRFYDTSVYWESQMTFINIIPCFWIESSVAKECLDARHGQIWAF